MTDGRPGTGRSERGLDRTRRPDRHRRRRRVHRRLAGALLPRPGLHPHPGGRQEAAARVVPARPGRRVPLDGPEPRGRTPSAPSRAPTEVYNLAADMGGMGFIERFRVECLRSILDQHAHDRGRVPGRRAALLLLLVRLRLQHGPPEDPEVPGAQGVRRLPGDGRARLRLGEADLGDVLPGVLGRARPEDPHRPLPQRLRPERHLGRRPREGAGRHVPQGHRGQGQRRPEDRDLGRRHADAQLHVHRRLPPRHRPDHALRRPDRHARSTSARASWCRSTSWCRSSRRSPA